MIEIDEDVIEKIKAIAEKRNTRSKISLSDKEEVYILRVNHGFTYPTIREYFIKYKGIEVSTQGLRQIVISLSERMEKYKSISFSDRVGEKAIRPAKTTENTKNGENCNDTKKEKIPPSSISALKSRLREIESIRLEKGKITPTLAKEMCMIEEKIKEINKKERNE